MLGLAVWDHGFRYFTNGKHPLKTPSDFKDLKFRLGIIITMPVPPA